MNKSYHHLLDKNLILPEQSEFLNEISTGKKYSLYFELRSFLYVGVLLFTTGIGLLIYTQLSNLMHYFALSILTGIIAICTWYVFKNNIPYSNEKVTPPTPYFDYVLLLGALVSISLLTYIAIFTGLYVQIATWSSLLISIFFGFLAFRYDHRGLLSLSITAFVAFWGIQLSPVYWMEGNFDNVGVIPYVGAAIGFTLLLLNYFLQFKKIKTHFGFLISNFGFILWYLGLHNGLFAKDLWMFGVVILFSSIAFGLYAWKHQQFLFFLYHATAFYIAFTYLLLKSIEPGVSFFLFYLMISMAAFITIILQKGKHFSTHGS